MSAPSTRAGVASPAMHVLMAAAEDDALPGGKVGGIGDVVRDLPPALARLGCAVSVVTPAYGRLAELAAARHVGDLEVSFRGSLQTVSLHEVAAPRPTQGVRHYVLDHPDLAPCGRGVIYCDDPPSRPFATDASKFALFCAAVAELTERDLLPTPDVLHLHDWHAALTLALRRYRVRPGGWRKLHCVFTIHNLALQGIRPFDGDESALDAWFPALPYQHAALADPRWPQCVNPMAVGIRLADAVHVVSPTYAREILTPGDPFGRGLHGGEGLEADLAAADAEGRLVGILNGCEYPQDAPPRPSWPALRDAMRAQNLVWSAGRATVASAHFVAQARLAGLGARRPSPLVTSIGRITAQKVRLLLERAGDGRPAIEAVLDTIGEDGLLVILGTGDPVLEQALVEVSARRGNLIFLRGYSDAVARDLYAAGDLFLMPSSFEPCGISQMLAMRAGQPCLVHRVGGLVDTVRPGVDGFGFEGSSVTAQVDGMVAALAGALALRRDDRPGWQRVRKAAAAARFSWDASAAACIERLYRPATTGAGGDDAA
ncbi:MAG: glycogen synthase [Ectothiorhodospiraceae bacterium]|nr:glycogen synthase [Ectothiorhodospiraceae bacterium]